MSQSPTSLIDDVFITEQLGKRPLRLRDSAGELEALASLAETLAARPDRLSQQLVEKLIGLSTAHTAGIGVVEKVRGGEQIRRIAWAGKWNRGRHRMMTLDASLSGVAMERDDVLLVEHPERFFSSAVSGDLSLDEMLLMPFRAGGQVVGALWLGGHGSAGKFDAGDAAMLKRFASFASAAHRMNETINSEAVRQNLERSEERLQCAIEVAQIGLWDWNVVTGEVHWSEEHFRQEGYEPGEIKPSYEAWAQRIHPQDRQNTEASLSLAQRTQEEFKNEFRVIHPDGSIHWLHGRGRFFFNDRGEAVRMVGAMVDTTERHEWEDRQGTLIAELQHRTRNLIAVVKSVSEKTARGSADLPDFRKRFSDRLSALARAESLLSDLNDHDRVPFDKLVVTELSAVNGSLDGMELKGPPGIRLRSSTVQMLGMALHELATNAIKYGALSQESARLVVSWSFEAAGEGGKPWLHIDWRESGVVIAPSTQRQKIGEGRALIERGLPYQIGAKVEYTLNADGVHCKIALPVSSNTMTSQA